MLQGTLILGDRIHEVATEFSINVWWTVSDQNKWSEKVAISREVAQSRGLGVECRDECTRVWLFIAWFK